MNGVMKIALAIVALFVLSGVVMASESSGTVAMTGTLYSHDLAFTPPTAPSGDIWTYTWEELAAGSVTKTGTLTGMSIKALGVYSIIVSDVSNGGYMRQSADYYTHLNDPFTVYSGIEGWKDLTASRTLFTGTDNSYALISDLNVPWSQTFYPTDKAGAYTITLTFTASSTW